MKEEEIRPKSVFDEYLRLAEEDAELYFSKSSKHEINCPACETSGVYIFEKHGHSYEECPCCQTIYVSPRPPAVDFFEYYKTSKSARYFGTVFYHATAESRREKLWRPKALKIAEIITKYGADSHKLIDIGGGHGIFAEEYQKISGKKVVIIEPSPESAQVCRDKGFTVIESFLETVDASEIPHQPKVFVSFELFEHLHSPQIFLRSLVKLMQPHDMFIFTTLSGIGLDIQVLWENSNSISLQHLNFFNPKSIEILLGDCGLNTLMVETPGKLDMDILIKNKNLVTDRFWRTLMNHLIPIQNEGEHN